MENNTIYTWLFLGVGLSIVSKILQSRGKKTTGNLLVIPAAWCLLIALMFSVTDFARLYGRNPPQAAGLMSVAGLTVAAFQVMMIGFTQKPPRKAGWLILVVIVGLAVFFWLWQRWV